jgi:3-oxoacyl-[acyl-carrier protein] reductase
MVDQTVLLVTGSRKGIGRLIAEYYLQKNYIVVGCSRGESDLIHNNYKHFAIDVADEKSVKQLFRDINQTFGRLDVLINNAGIASMNHALLTSIDTVHKILNTNVVGSFLFARESAKIMLRAKYGRIINFSTVAVPIKLEGEAIYAASKSAVNSLTHILAKEFAVYGITVNAIGPTPVKTDLIKNVPPQKIENLTKQIPLQRLGEISDIINVLDFYINPESDYITGQIIYLGGL